MALSDATGTRIRERRQVAGLRQADLARHIGISASYLNLIEHNRRRIGGKLLLQIAQTLGVEPVLLTEGAEAALISDLREAQADAGLDDVELDRIEEFAGRYPGWARLISAAHARVGQLEQMVDGLNDRLSNDPALAASVHEVLSTAASIHSTASILVETDTLERQWLDRFHANINEDSARLAESSRALAGYLENGPGQEPDATLKFPQEDVDEYLDARDFCFSELENGSATPEEVCTAAGLNAAASSILLLVLKGYAQDVKDVPLRRAKEAVEAVGALDPALLAAHLRAPVSVVMRRMASMPELGAGYVMCDRSGSLLLRKALPGFALPRFGASCPLWPLFETLSQPGALLHRLVEQLGRREVKFDCYATSEVIGAATYNAAPLLRAGMLILPSETLEHPEVRVGASCRICPKPECAARREPSVLPDQI